MKDVPRKRLTAEIRQALERSRAVAIIGPRQAGKTTLARALASERPGEFFDLEDPSDEARLRDPKLALEPLRGLVVIDEVQRRPDLLPLLRVLLDRRPLPARFLLLGSASPDLARGASESLAGRVEFIEMGGFTLDEPGPDAARRLWLRGGFPLSFLARDDEASLRWRESFVQALAERDLRMLGVDLPAAAVRRFLTMVAHYHGQTWNGSEIGRSMQLSHTTIRRYLDLLTGARILRQLPPWFENAGKRVVKSPKVYVRDSGILHALLGLVRHADLESHPKLGASWEGFALEQALAWAGDRHAYFWGTYGGAELDLCLMRGGMRLGLEFKYTSSPEVTKSMRIARADLGLGRMAVVVPGDKVFPLDEQTTAVGLASLQQWLDR